VSRSYKHYCGGKGSSDDSGWAKDWHRKFRRKTHQLILLQILDPEIDIIYPKEDEVGNLWCAPSDGGGSLWYCNFYEFVYHQSISKFRKENILHLDQLWKKWKIHFIGK